MGQVNYGGECKLAVLDGCIYVCQLGCKEPKKTALAMRNPIKLHGHLVLL